MGPTSGFLLEILGGLLFVLAGIVNLAGCVVDGAFGLSLLAGGVVLVFYALGRPKGLLRGVGLFIVGLLALGAVASGGFSMEAPNTSLIFSATKAQVPQHFLVITATTGAGSISLTNSNDLTVAYQVTFKYPGGRRAFPSFTIVPRLTNSSSGDTFRLNLNGAGAEIEIVLGTGYALNASLHTNGGNVLFSQEGTMQVLSLDCTTNAGNIELITVTAPYINCRSTAGNMDASIGAFHTTGTASLSTSAGNVHLELRADSATGVWLRGVTSLGSVTPPGTNGMEVLAQSGTEFEGQTLNYASFTYHYQVTCTSILGNVEIGFGVTG